MIETADRDKMVYQRAYVEDDGSSCSARVTF